MDDLISRQAAIDAATYGNPQTAWQRIEALPSVQSEQWIPCSERLPEEEMDVLICNGDGDIGLSRGSYSTEVENDFIWYTSGWRFGKVIAWMPLPEPYKGEQE